MLTLLALTTLDAHGAFWDRPLRANLALGLSAIVTLGPRGDRARFGAGIDGSTQWIWHEGAYWHEGPPLPSPLLEAALHVGWTHPVSFIELTAGAGGVMPSIVSDGGFIPAIGGTAGGGLGFATDGWAGAVVQGLVIAPFSQARIEGAPSADGWTGQRLAIGPMLAPNCCNYYQ